MDTNQTLENQDACAGLAAATGSDCWYGVPLSRRQMGVLEMLVRFHAAESQNPRAKEDASKLAHWVRRNAVPTDHRMSRDELLEINPNCDSPTEKG